MRVGLAFGAGGNHEGFFGLGHGGPADFFNGVTKATFAEAAVVEFANADAGGRDGRRGLGSGVQGLGRILEGRLACGGGWGY